jgi:hypothetical protein
MFIQSITTLEEIILASCQKCQSERIMSICAKCQNSCIVTYGAEGGAGYAPTDVGVGVDEDYVAFEYCLECGQMQGEWPVQNPNMSGFD